MAPEYDRWFGVDPANRDKVQTFIGNKSRLDDLLRTGLVFKIVDGDLKDVLPQSDVSKGVLKDARKQKSPWHWVHGLYDPEKRTHE